MNGSFDWITVVAIFVFWGWLLRRTLRGTPKNRLLNWLLVWFALVLGVVMLWNTYVLMSSPS